MEIASSVGAVTAVEPTSTASIHVPYGATLASDTQAFNSTMDAAMVQNGQDSNSVNSLAKAAFEPLDQINKEAQALGDYAASAVESGNTLTPGEIVNLTVQSQKFMFHSQLVANIANRSADGIQQLFRQQG